MVCHAILHLQTTLQLQHNEQSYYRYLCEFNYNSIGLTAWHLSVN